MSDVQKQLEEIRERWVSDPTLTDEEREENARTIAEWEQTLQSSAAFQNWRGHEITLEISDKAREAYRDASLILATNRELTDRDRFELYAKQDAAIWILNLTTDDLSAQMASIEQEIRFAMDAT